MFELVVIILMLVVILTIGMELNFIKWIKQGKEYKDKYDEWMNEKP